MAGEEVFLSPWAGVLNAVIPVLQIVFLLSIVSLVLFIFWKRQPFKKYTTRVLVKHRRGQDFTPEMTEGRREKNPDGLMGYRLRNGDWIPAALFKDMHNMGKKPFLEVWETESGKYTSAPSPFQTSRELTLCPTCGKEAILKNAVKEVDGKKVDSTELVCPDGHDCTKPLKTTILTGVVNSINEFTQNDLNWLIDNHKSNIKMYEKKNFLKEWLPIIVPAVTIIIVALSLILMTTQVWIPLTDKALAVSSANAQYMGMLQNVTQMWFNQTNGIRVVPGG